MAREAQTLVEVEAERAKQRQRAHGDTAPGRKKTLGKNFPPVNGKARDVVGRQLGMSGRTVEKAVAVVEVVDTLTAQGKAVEAQHVRELLNKKSVDAAYRTAQVKGYV